MSDVFMTALDAEIAQAYERQKRLAIDVQIAQAKSEVVGEYRVKFMDLRDKIREQLKTATVKDTS